MLKFFFNRFSKMVLIMEALGIVFYAILLWKIFARGIGAVAMGLFLFVVLEYVFIRFCAIKRWHENAPRGFGIELQFKKAMVAASYILAITGLFMLFLKPTVFLLIAAVLLTVVAHVNVILLVFHWRDKKLKE